MRVEEVFSCLEEKYGEDFNWFVLSDAESYVSELKREFGQNHFLYEKSIKAVAKCEANDDVLFETESDESIKEYYIIHLTYSKHLKESFPKYKKYTNIKAVKEEIERVFVEEYL